MPDKVGAIMHFEGNRFWFEGNRGFEIIDIDTATEPFRIDFWAGGSTVQGTFQIVGQTLVVCSAPPGVSRPNSLDPTVNPRYILSEAVRRSP
jgi:uncharacterized protein (TIGR03067 family)